MEQYSYKIYQNRYIDDYENGEMFDSFCSNCLEDGKAKDKDILARKVAEFKAEHLPESEVYIDDNIIHGDLMMRRGEDGCFYKATDAEIENWKQGKQRLWNVEYCMHISVTRPIEEDELKDALDGEVVIAE